MRFYLRGEKMKHFNNLRILTSFREISTVLEIIAKAMRIFTFVLVILQGVALIAEAKGSKIKKL